MTYVLARVSVVAAITIGCLVSSVLAEEPTAAKDTTRSPVVEQLLQQQSYEVGAILRSDMARLGAIESFLETAMSRNQTDQLLERIERIEIVLRDLRLPRSELGAAIETVRCLRVALDVGRHPVSCKPREEVVIKKARKINPSAEASRIVAQSSQVSIVANPLQVKAALPSGYGVTALQEEQRSDYSIAFYGHATDRELGKLFSIVAERDPDLLRPIPIDRDFQYKRCINGSLYPVVGTDSAGTEWRYKRMLQQTAEPDEIPGEGLFRFSMLESDLPAKRARARDSYPASLADFSINDAYDLSIDVFTQDYGLAALSGDTALNALHALWSVLQQDEFSRVINEFLGTKDLNSASFGKALADTGLNGQDLWDRIYESSGQSLHCSDANKVFEAYGLVYRGGDYSLSLEVLRKLRDELGFAAVPSVQVSPVQRKFLEATQQVCAAYGPVEFDYSNGDAQGCSLGEINIGGGKKKYIFIAGGAEVTFKVTPEQRELLAEILIELDSEQRDGDILRWSARGDTSIASQNMGSSLALRRLDDSLETLPCVLGMSYYLEASNTKDIVNHFNDYKSNFYPIVDGGITGGKWQLFVIDEFNPHGNRAFREELMPLALELESLLATAQQSEELMDLKLGSIIPQIGEGWAEVDNRQDSVGLEVIPEEHTNLCGKVSEQIEKAKDASHGAFIESLLIGGATVMDEIKGLGLLNEEGKLSREDFDKHYERFAAEGKISLVATHVTNIGESLREEGESAQIAVVNLSLGERYDETTGSAKLDAITAVETLAADFAANSSRALFVVAAGQPPVPVGVRDQRDLETLVRSVKLSSISFDKAKITNDDCVYYPACLSMLNNVITVGAVKPSHGGRGYRTAALMPWSNYGPAVTVAAPGQSVLGNELAFLPRNDGARLSTLPISSLRDGTSVATAFVSALATKLAAQYPQLTPAEIKLRLVSTVRPYRTTATDVTEDDQEELLAGDHGQLYAGVIDPKAALRDPSMYHVTYRDGSTRSFDRIELLERYMTQDRPVYIYDTTATSERAESHCDWNRLLRLHFAEETDEDGQGNLIPEGAMACETDGVMKVGAGFFGTKDIDQNTCMADGACFLASSIERFERVELRIEDVRDIYFPVVIR